MGATAYIRTMSELLTDPRAVLNTANWILVTVVFGGAAVLWSRHSSGRRSRSGGRIALQQEFVADVLRWVVVGSAVWSLEYAIVVFSSEFQWHHWLDYTLN